MTLRVEEFEGWLKAVHDQSPFPWQRRLLDEILERGWPTTLRLPTSSGKTTVLDIAVFALAIQAQQDFKPRTMPMRIALVVDRRIVVDGAFARACRIRNALAKPTDAVVQEVATALSRFGGETPLHAALLRGGIYREDRWARQPNQPTILCSTVDQVGSRLLHRGYGLSPRTWSIHGGLLGNDTLIVLDEAHCSVAFHDTLDAIARLRSQAEKTPHVPWRALAMTATPRDDLKPFEIDAEDLAHSGLRRRLEGSKPISMAVAEARGQRGLSAALLNAISPLVGDGQTVLVVVNRVRAAREMFQLLQKKIREADIVLLTGRSRSIQRDAIFEEQRRRLMAGRDRAAVSAERCLIVVATQCVEVGADLDVDALVTEACPLDSLKQRLGRLDRLGEKGLAPCTIVVPAEALWDGGGKAPEDAIYGEAVARTACWLATESKELPLDGGVLAFGDRTAECDASLNAPQIRAPIIFPAYCDLWVQTGPRPFSSPEPAPFLHGPNSAAADVQIVWRADLDAEHPETWLDAVALCPPVSGETLSMRPWDVRDWLLGRGDKSEATDLEGVADKTAESAEEPSLRRPFLRWNGPERSELVIDADTLRPGDTIVVPTSYGGCDRYGWNPEAETVDDLADVARIAARRAPTLRIHPACLPAGSDGVALALALALAARNTSEVPDDIEDLVAEALRVLAGVSGALGDISAALRLDPRKRIVAHPGGRGVVVVGRAGWATQARDFSDEDESSSRAPVEVGLTRHLGDVRTLAGEYARALGLSNELIEDLALAGWIHDLGKADPRFQAWLRDGDWLQAMRGEALAKSPRLPPNPAAMAAARERAGYPVGGRHELLSVRLAESSPTLLEGAHDLDLVLHLVASHHGFCRPFAPVVDDVRPLEVTFSIDGETLAASSRTGLEHLDSGVPARFFRLIRRYGWWGLSYLEACLRLADHRASEAAVEGVQS